MEASSGERPVGAVVANAEVPAGRPGRISIRGRTVSLVPLESRHADQLYPLIAGKENEQLWDYMLVGPFKSVHEFKECITSYANSTDDAFYAIIDNATSEAVGYISFLNINPTHKSIELGNILYTSKLQRTVGATEAVYLMSRYALEDLGYRRYEWKCNNLNAPSRRAALRYGFQFEGVFRNHFIVKGRSRDTAWFSILDSEWPVGKKAFEGWLDPSNFDANGKQLRKLEQFRQS
ncbi:hypothetical protein AWJ20_812 [Sugiyamaella lignohabitans]|uniref:N-acetyltransferase domain-containing protein n=1 Tax=Sugiyamaella lignohabitans TaxID=796027 RepID=A0A167D6X5_9ASCO|nr:uncharacterized protein AWJ20_812 [Sugiyamaella lignohabitans]ANB12555.1 hypothetical protein AWJ20_812 [Sugiyamaella lignohabitans]